VDAESVRDHWQILGSIVEEEESLRVQRVWMIGQSTQRPALSLSFAAGAQALDVTLPIGDVIDAEVVFHPSAAPLRAVVRQKHGNSQGISDAGARANFSEALSDSAKLFAGDPWLDRVPWHVKDCTPLPLEDGWCLRDAQGAVVPMPPNFENAWALFALSGGRPVRIFGEWNGYHLRPLSVVAEKLFAPLT
jgi:hypothetical protein